MSEIIPYKCLRIYSPTPSGDAGRMINDNFIIIADAIEGGISGFSGTSGLSGASNSSVPLPPPILRLDSYTLTKIHFSNRPVGASVLAFKYTSHISGPHIRGIRQNRLYHVYLASTAHVEIYANVITNAIDGVTITSADINKYILLKNQNNVSENYIYSISGVDESGVTISNPYVNTVKAGAHVLSGITNSNSIFVANGQNWIELETSGNRVYSVRMGKGFRQAANLGAVDSWDAVNFYETMGKCGSYVFSYFVDSSNVVGPLSQIVRFNGYTGQTKRWRF